VNNVSFNKKPLRVVVFIFWYYYIGFTIELLIINLFVAVGFLSGCEQLCMLVD
jgi:hypothetical protein